jgi:hypothetical protein
MCERVQVLKFCVANSVGLVNIFCFHKNELISYVCFLAATLTLEHMSTLTPSKRIGESGIGRKCSIREGMQEKNDVVNFLLGQIKGGSCRIVGHIH